MIAIRNFRNTDTPALARLWNAHRVQCGLEPTLTCPAVEVVVLGRPYFDPRHLQIAVDQDRVVGFLHWMPKVENAGQALVANLAVESHAHPERIAGQLIDESLQRARSVGVQEVYFGQSPDDWTGYAGVGAGGMGGGVPEFDTRANAWVRAAGFKPLRRLVTLHLRLAAYRPAIDRDLLALRRSATLDRSRDVTDQPYRIAASMSHLELHRFVARDRQGAPLAFAEIMLGDPEMSVVSGGTVVLARWGSDVPPPASTVAIRFAISGAVAELAAERAQQILATVEAESTADQQLLEQLGFNVEYRGTVYVRHLQ